ncbi:MAG: methionyl-tRNA formyltransferase [Desulfobacteraceae bacterium]|jgi:methionyl-tRNA formyltransferase
MTSLSKENFPGQPRLIFMGTPQFAVPTLEALIHGGHEILAVVTQPDRPKGRGRKRAPSPVKELAIAHQIEVLQPQKVSDDHFCDQIREMEPDMAIVVAFGQILKKNLLTIPGWGVINIHASLLPKHRGAAPIQWTILNGESKTGLTVMRMDEGLDTGPILFQKEVPILEDETAGQLHDRLSQLAGQVIIEALSHMTKTQVREIPQDDSLASYASKIEKGDSLVDWKQPATRISCLIRALDPRPGAYTLLEGKQIKLFSSTVVDRGGLDGVPGRVVRHTKDAIHVDTGQGMIGIREIQYPGKKRLSIPDFLRGFPLPEGTLFGD